MFSKGQMIFAALFAIAFIVAISYAFIKEKDQHRKNYKGVLWILIGFMTFIGLLWLLRTYLKP
jgi:hypothetical protein